MPDAYMAATGLEDTYLAPVPAAGKALAPIAGRRNPILTPHYIPMTARREFGRARTPSSQPTTSREALSPSHVCDATPLSRLHPPTFALAGWMGDDSTIAEEV